MVTEPTPRIQEVAALAQVSPMTVSRTLAGGKNVSKDKQRRVHEAIAQLGYHRNENARSIRPGQSTGLVGVAVTNFGNPYYGNLALGVEEIVAKHGKRILIANTGEDPDRERLAIADFLGRQVDGMIVVPTSTSSLSGRTDFNSNVPVVLASRAQDPIVTDSVVLDDIGGALRATASLLARGHRRIAFLGNQTSVWTGERRLEGFRRAHLEHGLAPDPQLIRQGQQSARDVHEVVRAMMELASPPTAIFSANNRNTVGALQALASMSIPLDQLPDMAAFDEIELQELLPVRLTVVSHDPALLGARAAEVLLERLTNGDAWTPRSIELPVEVLEITRQSW